MEGKGKAINQTFDEGPCARSWLYNQQDTSYSNIHIKGSGLPQEPAPETTKYLLLHVRFSVLCLGGRGVVLLKIIVIQTDGLKGLSESDVAIRRVVEPAVCFF